jgi:hypothetical protein
LVSGRCRVLAADPRPLAHGQAMKRPHRAIHRRLWPFLALAVAVAFSLALYLRPPP